MASEDLLKPLIDAANALLDGQPPASQPAGTINAVPGNACESHAHLAVADDDAGRRGQNLILPDRVWYDIGASVDTWNATIKLKEAIDSFAQRCDPEHDAYLCALSLAP